MREELTDIAGQHFETFLAILIKILPENVGTFGVGNKINVEGEDYRYQAVIAKKGHPMFDKMEEEYQKMNQ